MAIYQDQFYGLELLDDGNTAGSPGDRPQVSSPWVDPAAVRLPEVRWTRPGRGDLQVTATE